MASVWEFPQGTKYSISCLGKKVFLYIRHSRVHSSEITLIISLVFSPCGTCIYTVLRHT